MVKLSVDEPPPVISVAMPIYNAGVHLRLAVLSVLAQSFADWELLIMDDGSTDNALHSITDIADKRIRIFSDGSNRGLAARLNEACELSSGIYFARMDQDDVCYPSRFACQVNALRMDLSLDVVASRVITINEHNAMVGSFPHAISHDEVCAHPWRGFYFPHPSWMGRTAWFRDNRYEDKPAPYFCEDQELLTRCWRFSRFATVDQVLVAYRIRSTIDWYKLAKTRRATVDMQIKIFAQDRLWGQLALSLLSHVIKIGADIMRRRVGTFASATAPDSMLAADWNEVLKLLGQHPKLTS